MPHPLSRELPGSPPVRKAGTVRSALFVALSLFAATSSGRADTFPSTYLTEAPSHESIDLLGSFGTQFYPQPSGVPFGDVLEIDASGNRYHATGSQIAKYDAAGNLLWSQFQTPRTVTIGEAELAQTYQYDRWQNQDDQIDDIQVGYGEEDSLAQFFAQKIAIDSENNVYVSFLDLWHRDRSVLVKFHGTTGAVLWHARTRFPHVTYETDDYISKVVDLLPIAGASPCVALLETGIGSGHYVFTRLILFESAGVSREGVPRTVFHDADPFFGLVRLDDGGTNFRQSIGVGMALGGSGDLYYATFEGAAPIPLPTYPDPFPAPEKLVLRKLAAPYTGTPTVVSHDVSGIEHWYDLAVGPSGGIFVIGTDELHDGMSSESIVLASYDPATLAEVLAPTTYGATLADPIHQSWNMQGCQILATGSDVDDPLYLLSGNLDFRRDAHPDGVFGDNPAVVSAVKVDGAGQVLWAKYEPFVYAREGFLDSLGHLYLVGTDFSNHLGLFKYSSAGGLQVAERHSAPFAWYTPGSFEGALDANGDILVTFPQEDSTIPPGEPLHNWFQSPLLRFENPEILKATQTIEFHTYPSSLHIGQQFDLGAYNSSGLPVSFRISSGTAEIQGGNTFRATTPGYVVVEAYHAGDGIYEAASHSRTILVFGNTPQRIRFLAPSSLVFKKGRKFALSGRASSGLPVYYRSSNPRVIGIVGRVGVIRRPGRTIITASQNGNLRFLAAPSVSRAIRVVKPRRR